MRNQEPIYFAPQPKLGGGWIAFKDSPSPPPAPDYGQAAKDTARGNLDYARYTTLANRFNEYTPLGSRTWTRGGGGQPTFDQAGYDAAMDAYTKGLASGGGQTRRPGINGQYDEAGNWSGTDGLQYVANNQSGGAPNRDDFWNTGGNPDQWESRITLSPEMQKLFDQQNRISQGMGDLAEGGISRVQNATSKPFDYSSINDLVDKAQAAYMQRMDPVLARSRAAQEQTMANQGLRLGSEAYGTSQDIIGKQENDARGQAILQAMSLSPQLLAQALTLRNQPLNELNALRSGSQVSMPSFGPAGQQATVAGPNLLGAAQAQSGYNQGVYNAQQASDSAMTNGLFGLAGIGAKMFMPGLMGIGAGGGGIA